MQSCIVPDLLSASKTGPVTHSSSATALLGAITREFHLDAPGGRALVQAASAVAPQPRRGVPAWAHAVVTFLF